MAVERRPLRIKIFSMLLLVPPVIYLIFYLKDYHIIKDAAPEELVPVGMHFGIKLGESISDFKYELLRVAKSSPQKFISSFDDPVVAMKAKLTRAADFGVINLNDSGAFWADGNRLIVATPTGYSSLNTLTQHCLTDKGASTFAKIESELDKINQ